jgi:hypothetical protein
MNSILRFLFGCPHSNYSFPRTPRGKDRPQAAAITGTYVVCLDCARELPYDLNEMRLVPKKRINSTIVPKLETTK